MMNDPCGSSYVSDAQRSTPKQKIVLAVTEHPPAPIESQKEKETNEVNTSLPSPLFDAMIAEAKLAPVHKALANATRIIYVFGSTRENLKLGPVKITNPVLIQYAQQLFPAIYLLMFVWAALDSPTTLWISLWKTTIYGILYWMALEMLEWWDAEVPDVLLEPLVYRFPVAVSAGAKTVGFRVGEIIGMFMEGFWDGYQRSNAV
jgi:hypothetical protein